MFNLKLFKKEPKYFPSDRTFESNFINPEKWKHLKCEITIRHCRGHDIILILFDFKGFYQQQVRAVVSQKNLELRFLMRYPKVNVVIILDLKEQ